MFFFRRKITSQDQEKEGEKTSPIRDRSNLSSQTTANSISRPVTRVGSVARMSRETSNYRRSNFSTTTSTSSSSSDLSFDERMQAARERLQAQLDARKASMQNENLYKKPLDQRTEQRLNRIGLPAEKDATSASARAGFSRNPDAIPTIRRSQNGDGSLSDMQYRRFAAYLQDKTGIVLGEGKQYLVSSRLTTLMTRYRCDSIDTLLTLVCEEKNKKLTEEALDAMTTNETLWFRDTYPYLALQNIIIPDLVMRGTDHQVRIWSAACSSGQEPYSIAITILEMMGRMVHIDPSLVQIIGTDLSNEMLQRCRAGLYDAHALSRGLTAERRAKYFKPTHNPALMRIDPRISRMVEFRPLNLLGSFALMGHFDVIFCRNVLIYFNNDVKRQILNKFLMCLNPGGYLILGSTETVTGVADKFEMIRCNPGIIYKRRS